MTSGGSLGHRLDRWLDECKMALSGVVLATREPRFLVAFAISFCVFGTLMNLLSGSSAAFDLFWYVDLGQKLRILGDGFLGVFGYNRNFLDWLLTFFITILQSVLIGLVVFVWQKRRRIRREQTRANLTNASNVQDAGLAAGLAILGSGCPTCGTTLLAPALGAIFSSSGYMVAGLVSGLLTVASVLLALFALKRIGKDAFVMIKSERFLTRHPRAPIVCAPHDAASDASSGAASTRATSSAHSASSRATPAADRSDSAVRTASAARSQKGSPDGN